MLAALGLSSHDFSLCFGMCIGCFRNIGEPHPPLPQTEPSASFDTYIPLYEVDPKVLLRKLCRDPVGLQGLGSSFQSLGFSV